MLPSGVYRGLLPMVGGQCVAAARGVSCRGTEGLRGLFARGCPRRTRAKTVCNIHFDALRVGDSVTGGFVLRATVVCNTIMLVIVYLAMLSLRRLLSTKRCGCHFSMLQGLKTRRGRVKGLVLRRLDI